jgi:hypothetical protein
MATKENQGLQASIIVLAILVIGLGVGLLLVNNAKKTAQAQAKSAEDASNQARNDAAEVQAEANTYKEWIGFGEGDNLQSNTELFNSDVAEYGKNMAEESRNYRTLLSNIYVASQKAVDNESKAKADLKAMNDRLLALEAQKEAQIKQHQAALAKASADLATEKANFAKFRDTIQAEKDKIAADLAALQTQHDEEMAKLGAEKTTLTNTIGTLERSIDKLKEGLPSPDEFAQPADGRVSWVSQEHGKVWIDLGTADGLRPQVTFKVVDVTDSDAEKTKEKASIEVVRVLDDHMAEARITTDDPKNPVMVGDRIYSLVWDRGRQVGFSIAGFIDIDKDRQSDLQMLKNIIASNNGRVDAAPDDAGAKQGDTKVETRYLILGEYPEDPRQQKLRESWVTISDEAEKLGVQSIALDEFLKLMGWQADSQSVALDAGSRAEDFPPDPRTDEMPRKTRQPAGVFKKRLPEVSF